MTNPAAFKACFADWKLIRTRSCVQLVFEVPLEAADEAYQVVGGMPDPSKSVWFAVARLAEGKEGEANTELEVHRSSDKPDKTRPRVASEQPRGAKSWHSMSAAQQAGILCSDPKFQKFLLETLTWPSRTWINDGENINDPIHAASAQVRAHCGVDSRSEIDRSPTATAEWRKLASDFRAWEAAPRAGL